jgi:hypothetical protein
MAWKWVKEHFKRVWRPSETLFSMSLAAVFFFMATISALLLIGVRQVQLTYFWIAAGVWFIVALLTLIRIKMEPNKSDIIISKLNKLLGEDEAVDIGDVNREIREHLKKIERKRTKGKNL